MGLEFRNLYADEIECRVATCTKGGCSVLLYKDARVDQRLLDEVVGPMNWQRHHSRENANCTVAIWDETKKQWIEKEDTGKESFTEAEKGLASDSFKRACFNWGIGRSLYTAPFIWITDATMEPKQNGPGYTTKDRFEVSQIGYDENNNINHLIIRNSKSKKVVWSTGTKAEPKAEPKAETKPEVKEEAREKTEEQMMATGKEKINQVQVKALKEACKNHNVQEDKILRLYKVKAIEDLTVNQLSNINRNWEKIQKA